MQKAWKNGFELSDVANDGNPVRSAPLKLLFVESLLSSLADKMLDCDVSLISCFGLLLLLNGSKSSKQSGAALLSPLSRDSIILCLDRFVRRPLRLARLKNFKWLQKCILMLVKMFKGKTFPEDLHALTMPAFMHFLKRQSLQFLPFVTTWQFPLPKQLNFMYESFAILRIKNPFFEILKENEKIRPKNYWTSFFSWKHFFNNFRILAHNFTKLTQFSKISWKNNDFPIYIFHDPVKFSNVQKTQKLIF
jgi:hypothetical protein